VLGNSVAFEAATSVSLSDSSLGITEFDRPSRFVDEMIEGAFKRLRHVHEFEFNEGTTVMPATRLEWEAPFGVIGDSADLLFLRRHMRWFVSTEANRAQLIAEERAAIRPSSSEPGLRRFARLSLSQTSTRATRALDRDPTYLLSRGTIFQCARFRKPEVDNL